MSFEGAVVATGALTILSILAAHFSRNAKEPDTTLTRLEQKYFEPEVYAAQQAEIEAERLRSIAAAEQHISKGVTRKFDKFQ